MTNQQIEAAMKTVAAVGMAIREAGEIPTGHLYAHLMAHGCTLASFEKIIGMLTRKPEDGSKPLVVKRGDLLVWNG